VSDEIVIFAWLGIVGVIGLNGFAAGVAAVLHLWQSRMRRAPRIVLAAGVTGLLPASLILVMGLTDRTFLMGEGPFVMLVVFAILFGPGAVLALPGAVVITRKLAQPNVDYRAFE
jgi:hypothetical protein